MQIRPTSFGFTLLLGLLAAVPYSGIDINLPPRRLRHAASAPRNGLTMSASCHCLAPPQTVSDRFGRKPVVVFGVALFVVASLACAVAQSLAELLICRVQGSARQHSDDLAIIRDLFDETTAR